MTAKKTRPASDSTASRVTGVAAASASPNPRKGKPEKGILVSFLPDPSPAHTLALTPMVFLSRTELWSTQSWTCPVYYFRSPAPVAADALPVADLPVRAGPGQYLLRPPSCSAVEKRLLASHTLPVLQSPVRMTLIADFKNQTPQSGGSVWIRKAMVRSPENSVSPTKHKSQQMNLQNHWRRGESSFLSLVPGRVISRLPKLQP